MVDKATLLKFLRKQIKKWSVNRHRAVKALKAEHSTNILLAKEFSDGNVHACIQMYYLLKKL